ncbi:Polysaccharide pyruvyl transferase [Lachnospiraceae bacterium NE2001]|nr:Polysaccharide pyruvyl transferase [Lachnospiraceae bacterium NE2001]
MRNHKIGILTIHFGRNYGSVLQAFALNSYISGLGFDVETINYIPSRFSLIERYKAAHGKNPMIMIVASILRFPKNCKQYHLFARFVRENIKLSRKATNYEQLNQVSDAYSCVIVGSDQVWNSEYNKDDQQHYFLDFCDSNTVKASYAASFGTDEIDEQTRILIDKYLKLFRAVSVREKVGVCLLKQQGIYSEKSIDPVFLLDNATWKRFLSKSTLERYVAVYALGGKEEEVVRYAKYVAKELDAEVCYIGFRKLKDRDIKQNLYASPDDFLNLINNACFVITNSFHATSFSIIFKKQFITVGRDRFNSRITDVLDLLRLSDRLVTSYNEEVISNLTHTDIDYVSAYELLEDQKRLSMRYLEELLNGQ